MRVRGVMAASSSERSSVQAEAGSVLVAPSAGGWRGT